MTGRKVTVDFTVKATVVTPLGDDMTLGAAREQFTHALREVITDEIDPEGQLVHWDADVEVRFSS